MKQMLAISIFILQHVLVAQSYLPDEEFLVNTYTKDVQVGGAITALSNGRFVICWNSWGQDGSEYGVYARIYNSDLCSLGREFRVNGNTEGRQEGPTAAALSNGRFVVCWLSENPDGPGHGIYARLFTDERTALTWEFRVSTNRTGNADPIISSLANGGFIVYWLSEDKRDVYAKVFDDNGAPLGAEIKLDISGVNDLELQEISATVLKNGNFVVSWQQWTVGGNYQRIFKPDGSPAGEIVNPTLFADSLGQAYGARLMALSDGGFVACWSQAPGDHFQDDIYAQLFSAEGSFVGQSFLVNTYTLGMQSNPYVASLDDRFIICWTSSNQDGSGWGGYAQLFSNDGMRIGGEFRLNEQTLNNQRVTAVTGLTDGRIAACWHSKHLDGEFDIFARVFPKNPYLYQLHSFSILSPLTDSTIESERVKIRWQRPGTDSLMYFWQYSFDVYYDTANTFKTARIFRAGPDTSAELVNLEKGTTYFVKVLARNAYSDSLWSSNETAFFISYTTTKTEHTRQQQPDEFEMLQNFPNPFNPMTTIFYELQDDVGIKLTVYDINGRKVIKLYDGIQNAGQHSILWDGLNESGAPVASGTYFVHLTSDGFSQSTKMLLLR